MDIDPGTVTRVRDIDQSPEAQWALLRRCPFKFEHLEAIIDALNKEKETKPVQLEDQQTTSLEEEHKE